MWPPKCFSMKGVSICEPSSGEIGRRLKTAKVILICIKIINADGIFEIQVATRFNNL